MSGLRVTPDGRYLMRGDGAPFFYLGDTAWELFHRLTLKEADLYLRNRAAKGFTVIQAVALAELDGLHALNALGDCPLIDNDPARPNDAYFRHVDAIVDRAAELGLTIGMLPTWGDKVGPVAWGVGPQVFTPENARAYGEFLGRRYADRPLIWILGGDRPIRDEAQLLIWRAMAEGLTAGDGGRHLKTFHPPGRHSSSEYVHHEPWLDFNMIQSGHNHRQAANYAHVERDYALQPVKPTLDGEPRYEDHPVDWKPEELGWMEAEDVRKALYWGLLAGGCGVTYGCHDIWQFWHRGLPPVSYARTEWRAALDLPASFQAGYARALYESRPFTRLAPAQELIVDGQGEGAHHARAALASDGSFAFIYHPTGRPLTLDLRALSAGALSASWFDPRRGTWQPAATVKGANPRPFTPPTTGYGADWVLVLDDPAAGYPVPA